MNIYVPVISCLIDKLVYILGGLSADGVSFYSLYDALFKYRGLLHPCS